tara:strand:- start:50 stop:220 length:171 start_codon:yes stop_codon:yes gene_type:complete
LETNDNNPEKKTESKAKSINTSGSMCVDSAHFPQHYITAAYLNMRIERKKTLAASQ